jgi:hypothetical protein
VRGTEADVTGGYNSVFLSLKHLGMRTSLIIDPPNGRIPPLAPKAQKIVAAEREFRLALLQATETCKSHLAPCSGGKYDPTPSPRRAELAPRYNTARINRHDGPEEVEGVTYEFHHLGIPTQSERPGERYSDVYAMYTSDDPCRVARVQWHRLSQSGDRADEGDADK